MSERSEHDDDSDACTVRGVCSRHECLCPCAPCDERGGPGRSHSATRRDNEVFGMNWTEHGADCGIYSLSDDQPVSEAEGRVGVYRSQGKTVKGRHQVNNTVKLVQAPPEHLAGAPADSGTGGIIVHAGNPSSQLASSSRLDYLIGCLKGGVALEPNDELDKLAEEALKAQDQLAKNFDAEAWAKQMAEEASKFED